MRWVVTGLAVLLLLGSGVWFASGVGWDTTVAASTGGPYAKEPRCGRIGVGGQLFVPATDIVQHGSTYDLDIGPMPDGGRAVVHHQWFHPNRYTLLAADGARVPLRAWGVACSTP